MSSDSSANLSTMARSKLHSGSKDNSLHRFVLLKNSILRSLPPNPVCEPRQAQNESSGDDAEEEHEELDSFMFPDVAKFVESPTVDPSNAEAQWLDSLLESLGDDEDYDLDEDQLLSPLPSPNSSSDDLTAQTYYPPPLYPPLSVSYSTSFPHFTSSFSSHDEPLPYYDQDVEELSVPDAIEDTSDDESEMPTTPSLGRSRSSISLIDPASIPLPLEHSGLRHPHIYDDTSESYFYPLPIPSDRLLTYDIYTEC